MQFPTRCVHNLAIDWLDENYIASGYPGGEGSICIWDRRSGSRNASAAVPPPTSIESGQLSAALEFKNVIDPKSTIWSLRFSRTKRGCLGMLANDGTFKAYDIAKEYVSGEHRASLEQTLGYDSANAYPEQIYAKHVRDFRDPLRRSVPDGSRKVATFDFRNFDLSNEPSAVTLLANKEISIFTLRPQPSPMDISSQSVLARGGRAPESYLDVIPAQLAPDTKVAQIAREISSRSIGADLSRGTPGSVNQRSNSKREKRENSLLAGTSRPLLYAQDALAWLSIPRMRCKEGYLFDNIKNKTILSDDPDLQELWDWIRRMFQQKSPPHHGHTLVSNELTRFALTLIR